MEVGEFNKDNKLLTGN